LVKVHRNKLVSPEEGRGIAVHSLDYVARRGWSAPRPGRFIPGKDLVPIVQKEDVEGTNINKLMICASLTLWRRNFLLHFSTFCI
jgi:hypothetical protein